MSEVSSLPPGWADADLERTAKANYGLGTEAGLPDDVRFLVGVARVIRRRYQEGGSGCESTPAIFFLSPNVGVVDPGDLKQQPMLDNGLTALGGYFWFVGSPVYCGQGLEIDDWSDDGEIFRKASNDFGLSEVAAIVFEPRGKAPTLRHYPDGLGSPNNVTVSSFGGERMDLDRVVEIVDEATTCHLDGPTSGAGLWADPKKHWPSESAEKKIQFALKVALHHTLPTAVIREEQSGLSGRLDLEVEEPLIEEDKFIRHAILELKVLRSYSASGGEISPAKVRKVVREGVSQAVAYRSERGAKAAALCCFDMRVKDARRQCFNGVKAAASREKLMLRVWPIYASATERRSASL
jgi:hypothetical protein